MTTLACLRCHHQWTNNGEPPQCCPRCRNYNYDRPHDAGPRFPAPKLGIQDTAGVGKQLELQAYLNEATLKEINKRSKWIRR